MTTEGDHTLGDMAIVTFIQALAATIGNFNDVPLDDRTGASFIRVFDGYLEEITRMAEADGQDVRGNVTFLRDAAPERS